MEIIVNVSIFPWKYTILSAAVLCMLKPFLGTWLIIALFPVLYKIEATQKTCVSFRADRWYPIANATIQHEMKVYDYYEPGMFHLFYLKLLQH